MATNRVTGPTYDAAAADSWQRVLAFFAEYLAGRSGTGTLTAHKA